MPMGIVSDKEFDSELGNCVPNSKSNSINPQPVITGTIVDSPSKGRGEGNVEVPNGLRKLIGDESINNGRASALELASNLGISPSSVSAYSQGATSTASYGDRPNLSQINAAKEKISKRARAKLMLALRNITPQKLEDTKVRDLAGIARDMSAVIKNIEPEEKKESSEKQGPTFIFYSPQFRREEHFDVVQVKE